MDEKSIYYYISYQQLGLSSDRQPDVVKWNSKYYLQVDENVDYKQYISLSIDKKPSKKGYPKPQSSKYEKVRPIMREIFLDYYNLALKNIDDQSTENGEYYLIRKGRKSFKVEFYSVDEKRKQSISISFGENIDELWVTLDCHPGHKYRPQARKEGSATSHEQFKQFLNLTLKFLYDSDSFHVYLETFINGFYDLVGGKNLSIDGFNISADKSFNAILDQLTAKKEALEKALIEDDVTKPIDRAKLRGEIEGLKYAISTININR